MAGGRVEISANGSCWTIEAVANAGWRFLYWTDDYGNTNPVRELSSSDFADADVTKSFNAVFQRYLCAYADYDVEITNPTAPNDYGRIDTVLEDGVIYMKPIATTGHSFAQWADGNASEKRAFVSGGVADTTFYATFIPQNTIGKVDFWRKDGFVVTTESPTDLTKRATFGGITVFYDGQYMSCAQPKASDVKTEAKVDKGVYLIPAAYGSTHALAGKKCHVVYKNASYEPIATLDTIIPFLIAGEETVTADGLGAGVHVLEGGVATFETTQEIAELDIYAGGKAIIAQGATVTASSVKMRADAVTYYKKGVWEYPVLYPDFTVRGSLTNNASNVVNYDYSLDWNAFYPLGLPDTVNTANVAYSSGNDARDHFVLGTYDGARRAVEEAGWVDCYDYATTPVHIDVASGKGYNIFAEGYFWNGKEQKSAIIRFPMTLDLSAGEAAKSISVEQHDATYKVDKNWNLISSPYLTSYRGNITLYKDDAPVIDEKTGNPKTLKYIIVPQENFMDFSAELVSTATLYPFHSYLIQFDADANKLMFEHPNPSARAAAPARRAANAQTTNELIAGITLSQNGKSDHTGLFIGEQYTNNYDFDADLAKMMGESSRIKLYSLSGSQKLAYIALPPAAGTGTLETIIPLGYDSAVVGQEMTFAIDTRRYPELLDDENIYQLNLIDDAEGITTNLLEGAYTCTAITKSDNSRFSLGIVYRAPQQQEITTDCEEVRSTSLPDGVYDLLGRPVRSNAYALPAGVYIVVREGKAEKEVIR